jgi:Putative metal-binding motif
MRIRLLLISIITALSLFTISCDFESFDFSKEGHWELPDGSVPEVDSHVDADAEPDSCIEEEEVCDNADNDCDGVIDNGFNLQEDPSNCGSCNNVCSFEYAVTTCVGGECQMGDCFPGHFNRNNDPSDGCEYGCFISNDGTELCDGVDNDCDGSVDEDFDLQVDPNNCGACSNVCVFLNGVGACSGSSCTIGSCVGGYADADGSPDNGCECKMDLTEGTTICTEGTPGTCAVTEVCADTDGDGTAYCATIPLEICDGKDNDCNGLTDADDDLAADAQVGITCYGDPDGLCAEPAHSGLTSCVNGIVECAGPNLLYTNSIAETCNGVDDDCDGVIDDSSSDAGASCGSSSTFPCSLGTILCVNAALECVGAVEPTGGETCNSVDDDCNGVVDDNPSDAGGQCDIPIPPPGGATSPCQAGTLQCTGGAIQCNGSIGPTSSVDSCGVDANCDGVLNNQPDLTSDIYNCGGCGNDCTTGGGLNVDWTCEASACVNNGCNPGYYDIDGAPGCEYPCIYNGSETCNGIDDDCNGLDDDGLTAPTPASVCGVSPAATAPECTSNVTVQCTAGTWQCTFPANVCNNVNCASTAEICDTLDNNCNGSLNENVPQYATSCTSDAGLPYPGHGACQTTGTFICDGDDAVKCDAVKGDCAPNCDEECDGIDNDCDGLVDEHLNTNSGDDYYVRPNVTLIGGGTYIMSFEASRPDSSDSVAGTGNGYTCSSGCTPLPNAPAGVPLDETVACSVTNKIPWFNVSPIEVEQACSAIGGRICTLDEWKTTCHSNNSCTWGYGTTCTSTENSTRFCNLASFDFDTSASADGIQDGLLPTESGELGQCYAEWGTDDVYDITGNLREITKISTDNYALMGGSFMHEVEDGATCDYDFYMVGEEFQLWDTGFRCCFDTDPR